MAWDSVQTETAIGEGGSSAWYALKPKERAYVQVERTDPGTTDSMIVSVYTSPDNGTNIDNLPAIEFQYAPSGTAPIASFIVSGPPYFRLTLTSIGTTDAVVMTVRITRDGGLS